MADDGPRPDPYKTPRSVRKGSRLMDAMLRCLKDKTPRGGYVAIAIRASDPQPVLGAAMLGVCEACGEVLWVAPSTVALGLEHVRFVCTVCVHPEMMALTAADIGPCVEPPKKGD